MQIVKMNVTTSNKYLFITLLIIQYFLVSCTLNASIESLNGSNEQNKNFIKFKTDNNGQNAEGAILDLTLNEGNLFLFSLLLNQPAQEDIELMVQLTSKIAPSNSEARVMERFSSVPKKILIAKGQSIGFLTLQTNSDSVYQHEDEEFEVVLVSSSASVDTSLSKLNLRIHDAAPAPQVYFTFASQNINENTATGSVNINLSAPSDKALQVKVKAIDLTAMQSTDYSFPIQTINFSHGETSKTISFSVIDRSGVQNARNFKLVLFDPQILTLGSQSEHLINIIDKDQPSLSINSPAAVNEGSSIAFTVTLNTAAFQTVSVDWSLQLISVDVNSVAAVSGVDIQASPVNGTLNFLAGEVSKTVTINTLANAGICELDKAFKMILANPVGATMAVPEGIGRILDVDLPIVKLATDVSVNENQAAGLSVAIDPVCPTKDVTVKYSTIDDSAVAGSDFTGATLASVTVVKNQTNVAISIPTIDDTTYESVESYKVSLSQPTNAILSASPSDVTKTVTVNDNDPLIVNLAVASQNVDEAIGIFGDWVPSLTAWQNRKAIHLKNNGAVLNNYPIMLKLDSSKINYAKFQSAGQDLRFTDESGNLLTYEIESWDVSGTSIVWVKIPNFASASVTKIFMYYNNSTAIDAQDKTNVWDANHQAVWHLNGTSQDSTSNAKDGTVTGATSVSSLIGKGLNFSGVSYVALPDTMTSNLSVMTLEGWFKTSQNDMVLFSWQNANYPTLPTSYVPTFYIGIDGLFRAEQWQGSSSPVTTTTAVNDNLWHYAVLTLNTNTQSLYVDGVLIGTLAGTVTNFTNTKSYIGIGYPNGWPNSAGGWRSMNGVLDEFRVSNTVRSAAWIQMNFDSMNDRIAIFDNEESFTSGLVNVSVQLSGTADSTVTVPYTLSGTATTGIDYISSSSISINSGNSSANISLRILRDNVVEATETLTLTLGTPTGAQLGSNVTHTVNISDEVLHNPVAVNDAFVISSLSPVYLNVLANDSDVDADVISISSIPNVSMGNAVISGNQILYTPSSQFSGTETIDYIITDNRGGTATASVTLSFQIPYTWTGLGLDANWNTANNWMGNSVPVVGSSVYFNNQCSSQCNPVINIPVTVKSIQLNPSYSGIITQNNGVTITVGSGGWTQYAGTFNGSDSQIAFEKMNLQGGLFNSTSSNLVLGLINTCTTVDLFRVANNSYFLPGTGTVKFNHSRNIASSCHSLGRIYTPSGFTFNNLFMDSVANSGGWYATYDAPNGFPLIVNGNFHIDGAVLKAAIELKGNYDFGNNAICNDILGSIKLNGTGNQTYTASSGCSPQLIIDKASGVVSPTNATNLQTMSLDIRSGSFDLANNSTIYLGRENCQSYNILKIAATGASLNLNGSNVSIGYGRSSVSSCGPTGVIDVPASFQFNNLTINGQIPGGWTTTISSVTTLNILGNLIYNALRININANLYGNLTYGTNLNYGTGIINFIGAVDQYISSTGGSLPTGNIIINKTGGVVKLLNSIAYTSAGQVLSVNAGNTFDMNSYNFTFPGSVSNLGIFQAGTIAAGCGVLTAGAYSGNASVCP